MSRCGCMRKPPQRRVFFSVVWVGGGGPVALLFPAIPFWGEVGFCKFLPVRREFGAGVSAQTATTTRKAEGTPSARETLTVTDNRTGRSYEVPITHGTIRASDLRQIKVDPKEFGMMSYDPAFNNTASCISRVTYIDGDAGILRYRGYPIDDLAEKSTYLETPYLLLHGELPTASQSKDWTDNVAHINFPHINVMHFFAGFPSTPAPCPTLIS